MCTNTSDEKDTRHPFVRARRTAEGWQIDLDMANWAAVMVALGVAIDASDGEWAARWRQLRTELSRG